MRDTPLAEANVRRPPFDLDAFDRWIAAVHSTGGSIHIDELFLGARGEDDPELALLALGQAVRVSGEAGRFSLDLGLRMTETPEPITVARLRKAPATWPPLLHLTVENKATWWRIFENPEISTIPIHSLMPDRQTKKRLEGYVAYAVSAWDAEEESYRRSIVVSKDFLFS